MDAQSTAKVERKIQLRIREWVERQRGKIVGSERRNVYNSIPVEWINPDSEMGRDIHDWQAQITSEEVLIVEIPVKELSTMAETQEWYQQNIGRFSMEQFDKIIRNGYFEEKLRDGNPGLQEAWEQYQIMLALCSDKTYHK